MKRFLDRPSPNRIIQGPRPTVGLVINTFAAVPYIHVALESWKLNNPNIPVLVSDDGSPKSQELRRLCAYYRADFVKNYRRHGRDLGDLSAYVHGLEWGAKQGLDIGVKMSRRFIPLHNWVPALQRLAYETQYATYSNQCRHYNYRPVVGVPNSFNSDFDVAVAVAVHRKTLMRLSVAPTQTVPASDKDMVGFGGPASS